MPPNSANVSQMTLKRIHREISDLKKENMGGMTLGPTEDSLFNWRASIPGPEGSCYEGGVFWMDIVLPVDYPFSAPKVQFTTRIYHMNISDRGNVCIDVLKNNWSPALSLYKVLLSLSSLLTDPNPKDPLVPDIAREYTRNRAQHNRTAQQWVQNYALPPAVKNTPLPSAPASISTSTSRASTGHASNRDDPIIIIDDDSPVPARQTGRRKRGEAETAQEGGERRKRARGSAASTSSAGPSGSSTQDVIVIDD